MWCKFGGILLQNSRLQNEIQAVSPWFHLVAMWHRRKEFPLFTDGSLVENITSPHPVTNTTMVYRFIWLWDKQLMPDKAHSSWINYIYEHVLPSTFSCSVYWHYFVNAWTFGWYKLATPLVIINTVLDIYKKTNKNSGVKLLLYHLSLAKFIPGSLVHWWKEVTVELHLLGSNWFSVKIYELFLIKNQLTTYTWYKKTNAIFK